MGLGLARSVITTKITRIVEEPQVSADVTGSVVGVLFGLDGFRVLAAADAGGEVELLVETTVSVAPCPDCGAVAKTKDRRPVWVRDLPIGGRPVVVCWHKRIWCCPQVLCPKKTWTEAHPAIESRACLTERAGPGRLSRSALVITRWRRWLLRSVWAGRPSCGSSPPAVCRSSTTRPGWTTRR
ncbi:hypothetical protein MKOR_33170 [Mycolicibacillus koreensis]|nr:hypothetical protein MKOR_33170 [Mycolicibacillus koreensis]